MKSTFLLQKFKNMYEGYIYISDIEKCIKKLFPNRVLEMKANFTLMQSLCFAPCNVIYYSPGVSDIFFVQSFLTQNLLKYFFSVNIYLAHVLSR